MQQELQQFKEQYARLEVLRDNLDREVKSIPALNESNEILKNDLANVRKRFKEEKASLQKHIKHLESRQSKEVESMKNEVRQLAMKLLEVSGQAQSSGLPPTYSSTMNHGNTSRYDPQSSIANNYRNPVAAPVSNITYDEDDDDDNDDGSYLAGDNENESEYDNNSFIDDSMSQASELPMPNVNSSLESNSHSHHAGMMQQMYHQQPQQSYQANNATPSNKNVGKKKKVKKAVVTSARAQGGNSSTGGGNHSSMNMMQSMGQGMQTSFSLPRI